MHPVRETEQTKIGQKLRISTFLAATKALFAAEYPHTDGLSPKLRACGVWRQVFPSHADTVDAVVLGGP